MLLFGVVGEGNLLSTAAPEDRITGKPIFHSTKDNHLLPAPTIEENALSG